MAENVFGFWLLIGVSPSVGNGIQAVCSPKIKRADA
jgi:hypothetical protein